jgi:DUF4097 and DUF4098 domain-containing protein YvlB
MLLPKAIAAALLLSASAAFADAHFDRTLSVSGPTDLYVSSNSGSVHIVPGSDSQIHISARLHADWNTEDDIDRRMQHIAANPPITQSGNTIHVGEVDSSGERARYNHISIDYEIAAPRSVALNLRTGSGDVEVDNLGRFLKVDTGSGSVRAHGIAGPADLHTGSGDIEIQEQAQADIRTSTGSGSIRINGFRGGLQARTGSGDIEANGALAGSGDLHSGSGSIRLHLGHEARFDLDANTGSGSVRVAQASRSSSDEDRHHLSASVNGGGPSLRVVTGSGDIEIN